MEEDFEKALDEMEKPPVVVEGEPGAVGNSLNEIDKGGIVGQINALSIADDLQNAFNTLSLWQKKYIAALRLKGNISLACLAAKVSRSTVNEYREADPVFNALCEDALNFNDDLVEGRAYQLGVEGFMEPVFQGGMCVGYKRVFSERLLEVMLKARKPNKFDTGKKLNITTTGGNTTPVMAVSDVAELVKNLSPTLAAGVLASRQKTINGQVEVIQKA
ncbi:MAG: hypothetical protein D4R57_01165 [Verrucomicrobiales bacterium]|nr:MAG: hypothetical protein D4R57_01165 [Verrucomicrobiales bacterium]